MFFGGDYGHGLGFKVGPPVAAAAPELLVNTGFDNGDNWTLTQQGGTELPTISGGVLNSTADNEGNLQFATQTLVGGSVPAGSYTVGASVPGDNVTVSLLGAGNETRGSVALAGVGATNTIVADGEVSKFQIRMVATLTVDDVSMTVA